MFWSFLEKVFVTNLFWISETLKDFGHLTQLFINLEEGPGEVGGGHCTWKYSPLTWSNEELPWTSRALSWSLGEEKTKNLILQTRTYFLISDNCNFIFKYCFLCFYISIFRTCLCNYILKCTLIFFMLM